MTLLWITVFRIRFTKLEPQELRIHLFYVYLLSVMKVIRVMQWTQRVITESDLVFNIASDWRKMLTSKKLIKIIDLI